MNNYPTHEQVALLLHEEATTTVATPCASCDVWRTPA